LLLKWQAIKAGSKNAVNNDNGISEPLSMLSGRKIIQNERALKFNERSSTFESIHNVSVHAAGKGYCGTSKKS
jgi:hypothetical protein